MKGRNRIILIYIYLNDIGLLPHRGIRAKLAQTDSAGGIIAAVWGMKTSRKSPNDVFHPHEHHLAQAVFY